MAEKPNDETKMMVRMSDFASEPKRMLPPIKGYEKQPLVSIDQAIKPLLSLVDDLEEMLWTVKQNCQHPQHRLSSDESAAIMLYTLEWMPHESSFYFILNNALRSQNRQELLPWFFYLRLFMYALAKLPTTTHRMIYRGIKMDLGEEFSKGKTFIWWSFSSCSSSIEVLEQFLGHEEHRTIFNIECDSAKDISQHSFYQNENEILMYPARQFEVVSSFNSGNQLRIIHVREIHPPFPLIHIPQVTLSPPSINKSKEIESSFARVQVSQPSLSKTIYENKRLQQLIEECKPRLNVNLDRQNLTDEDMTIVVKETIVNKQCRILKLAYNKITSVGASIIAEALKNNITLEEISIRCNPLCDAGAHALTKIFSLNNCKVYFLDFQDTGITDKGAEYLADMLKTNTTLKSLLLGGNEIGDHGVELLANVMAHQNIALISLCIDHNQLLTDLSIDALVKMLKQNRTLKRLYMEKCSLSEKGKERLREVVRSKNEFQLDI